MRPFPSGQRVLQRAEIGVALRLSATAISPSSSAALARQFLQRRHQRLEFVGPVEPVAGADRNPVAGDRGDGAIAVILDLVQPVISGGRCVHQCCELWLDEVPAAFALATCFEPRFGPIFAGRCCFLSRVAVAAFFAAPATISDRPVGCTARPCGSNARPLCRAAISSIARPDFTLGGFALRLDELAALALELVVLLDQEPVVLVLRRALAQLHQRPVCPAAACHAA